MTSLQDLREAASHRQAVEDKVDAALGRFFAVRRKETRTVMEVHEAFREVIFALMEEASATRGLIAALGVEKDVLEEGASRESAVPPIIEHKDDPLHYAPHMGFNACWKTVEGKPGNCRMPQYHEGECAPS